MPDSYSDLFFFRLTLIGPLFSEAPETTKAKSGQCKLIAKGPHDLFRHCATFSEIFSMSPKGPPSRFLIFCNRMYVNKSQRIPPCTFFNTMRLFDTMSPKGPPSIFLIFLQQTGFSKSPRPPLTIFKTLAF